MPLWGHDTYVRFRAANRWVDYFLPNAAAQPRRPLLILPRARWLPAIERILSGRLGDRWNARMFRSGRNRAVRFYGGTHSAAQIDQARNLHRYSLPGLGHAPAVYRRFMAGYGPRLSGRLSLEDMEAAFGGCPTDFQLRDERLEAIHAAQYASPISF